MGSVQREASSRSTRTPRSSWRSAPPVERRSPSPRRLPLIDVKSTEAQVNFTSEEIESLPVPRDLQGPLPARARRRRERPPGAQRRRLAAGQHLPARRHQHHQPRTTATSCRTSTSSTSTRSASSAAASPPSSAAPAAWWSTPSPSRAPTTSTARSRFEFQPSSFVSDSKDTDGPEHHRPDVLAASPRRPDPARPALVLRLGEPPDGHHHRPPQQPRRGARPKSSTTDEYFGKLTANPTASQFLNAAAALAQDDRRRTPASAPTPARASAATTRPTTCSAPAAGPGTSPPTASSRRKLQPRQGGELDRPGHRPRLPAGLQRRAPGPQRASSPPPPTSSSAAPPRVGQIVGGTGLAVNNQDFTRDEARATFQIFQDWGGHEPRLCGPASPTTRLRAPRAPRQRLGHVTWNPTTRQFTASYVSQPAAAHRPRHVLRRLRPGPVRPRRPR